MVYIEHSFGKRLVFVIFKYYCIVYCTIIPTILLSLVKAP